MLGLRRLDYKIRALESVITIAVTGALFNSEQIKRTKNCSIQLLADVAYY